MTNLKKLYANEIIMTYILHLSNLESFFVFNTGERGLIQLDNIY